MVQKSPLVLLWARGRLNTMAEAHGRVNCLPGYLIAVRKKGERKGNPGPNITFKYTPQEPDFLVRPHLLKAPPPSKAP